MSFDALGELVSRLSAAVNEAVDRPILLQINLPQPALPLDEAHFLRLTAWCYAFFFECGSPALKYLSSLVRARDMDLGRQVQEVQESVQVLRTSQSHNLSRSAGDEKKRRQAEIWMQQHGGEPCDWAKCCDALRESVLRAVRSMDEAWARATDHEEDRKISTKQLILASDQKWEAHQFDRIVEVSVNKLRICGLDIVAYRTTRLAKWQELARCFESRDSAEVGLAQAIEAELAALFGLRPEA